MDIMIPCEFCDEPIVETRLYIHLTTECSLAMASARSLRRRTTVSSSQDSNGNRYVLSDVVDALRRNEVLDARDQDEHEEDAHTRFDRYDELDEHYDRQIGNRASSSRIHFPTHALGSASSYSPTRAIVQHSPSYIVPFRPSRGGNPSLVFGESSYDANMAIVDRLGRVTVGVKDVGLVLKPSTSDDPILCPICQDLCPPLDAVFTTPCNHGFCMPCISKWLSQSLYCPVCKHRFDTPTTAT